MLKKPDVLLFDGPVVHYIPLHLMDKKFSNVFSPLGCSRGMGASQIAHNLRYHGFTVQIITYIYDFDLDELYKLAESFVGENTIIGFSAVFPKPELKSIISTMIGHLRRTYPKNPIVIGGNTIVRNDCVFDAYFTSYADDTFLEFVEYHNRRRPKILYQRFHESKIYESGSKRQAPIIDFANPVNRRFNIEQLAHRWHDHDCVQPGELLPIEISRGCIFQCDFCNYRLNGKKKFDYLRDPQLIVDEMIDNYDRFGVTRYQFLDDTFNDSTQKLQALYEKFKTLPFDLEFWAYCRADLMAAHREQIDMLQEMGLRYAYFGIESLNYESARSIGKGIKTDRLLEFLDDLYYNQPNINATLSFIAGLPFETEESLKNTWEWQRSRPRWSYINYPLLMYSDEDVTSKFNSAPEKYGYSFSQDYTQHRDFINNGIKHHWVNNSGLSEYQVHELLKQSPVRKTADGDDFEISPYANFILSNFCKLDLTGNGYSQCKTIIDNQYQSFISKYKSDINAVAQQYYE